MAMATAKASAAATTVAAAVAEETLMARMGRGPWLMGKKAWAVAATLTLTAAAAVATAPTWAQARR
jgi:hypothetical protein